MAKIKINGYLCERCEHKWVARNEKQPIVCPKCFPPNTIISGEFKKISDFKQGDFVFGISGNICKVNKKFEHNWDGELIEIKASGCLPIQLTPEHKIFSLHCIQKSNSKKRKFSRSYLPPKYIEAAFLRKRPVSKNINSCGDYLIIPKLKGTIKTKKIPLNKFTTSHGLKVMAGKKIKPYFLLDKDSAWLMGLYVAEGYSVSNKGEILFCLGKHEKKLRESLIQKISKIRLTHRIINNETAMIICANSRVLARAFKLWFGDNAKTKKIPDFILFHKDKKIYESFLKGYIEGDGNCKIRDNRARVNANTVSLTLALQLQLLSVRMRDFFNITKVDFSKYSSYYCGRKIQGGIGYFLRSSAGKISKLMGLPSLPRHNKSYVMFEDFVALPINKITKVKYKGPVFNIETEEGNYLAGNLSVKNCKSPYWNTPRRKKT